MNRKFDTIVAEWLLREDTKPSEETGNSSEGAGYAAMYDWLGIILIEDPDGSGTTILCKDDADRMFQWADLVHTFEPSAEPEEEDYVISPKIYVTPMMQTYETLDAALREIGEDMERNNFYPNVWLQDDHGGFTNVTQDVPNRR